MNSLLRTATTAGVVKSSLKISLVVGTILNLINQSESIFHGAPVAWINLILNYLIPYLVASYSAANNQREHDDKS